MSSWCESNESGKTGLFLLCLFCGLRNQNERRKCEKYRHEMRQRFATLREKNNNSFASLPNSHRAIEAVERKLIYAHMCVCVCETRIAKSFSCVFFCFSIFHFPFLLRVVFFASRQLFSHLSCSLSKTSLALFLGREHLTHPLNRGFDSTWRVTSAWLEICSLWGFVRFSNETPQSGMYTMISSISQHKSGSSFLERW